MTKTGKISRNLLTELGKCGILYSQTKEILKYKERCKMKSTGVVRRIDELGRLVLPAELRKLFDIGEKDALEVYTEGDMIILKKYEPACIFCGDARDVESFKGKNICKNCMKEMRG